MGNQQEGRHYDNFINSEWQEISPQSLTLDKPQYGKLTSLQNLQTQQIIQQYLLLFPTHQDYKIYENCYHWRVNEEFIVNTRYIQSEIIKESCSQTYSCKVYIENISTRLSDITDIPFPDNLYVLSSCLKGFNQLYNMIGYFQVQETFICIDQNAHIKVWMNSNLSINYPDSVDIFDINNGPLQTNMVAEIIKLISASTDHQTQPEMNFQNFLHRNNQQNPNFKQCKILLQQYASEIGVQIPKKFESIIEIMNEDHENSNQSQRRSIKQSQSQSKKSIKKSQNYKYPQKQNISDQPSLSYNPNRNYVLSNPFNHLFVNSNIDLQDRIPKNVQHRSFNPSIRLPSQKSQSLNYSPLVVNQFSNNLRKTSNNVLIQSVRQSQISQPSRFLVKSNQIATKVTFFYVNNNECIRQYSKQQQCKQKFSELNQYQNNQRQNVKFKDQISPQIKSQQNEKEDIQNHFQSQLPSYNYNCENMIIRTNDQERQPITLQEQQEFELDPDIVRDLNQYYF